jgi:4-amino-4-deoxy-L-arabinose transferase-like glycosyltransferase
MPHSIAYPHFLCTEAFAVHLHLSIGSFYFLTKYLLQRSGIVDVIISAMCIGLASFIRPVYALFPFVVFVVLIVLNWKKFWQYLMQYLFIAICPLLSWLAFIYTTTSVISLGHSDHSLGYNLHHRIVRMSGDIEGSVGPEYTARETATILEYIDFAITYPVVYIKTTLNDLVNIAFNSGINHLFSWYLGVFQVEEEYRLPLHGIKEKFGYIKMMMEMISNPSIFVLGNIFVNIIWSIGLVISIYAYYLFARDQRLPLSLRLIFVSFPLYIIFFSMLGISVRSGHRFPFEFLLALMFSIFIYRQRGPMSYRNQPFQSAPRKLA